MPYRNKQMLRDANGDLIPQYWDVTEQTFKPLTGSDGANDVQLTGGIVELYRIENVTVTPGGLAFGYAETVGTRYDFDEIRVNFSSDGNHKFRVQVIYRDILGSGRNDGSVTLDGEAQSFQGTITDKIGSTRYSFAFFNNDTKDVFYHYIQILGVRK